ncbi:MAG: hypothetical protein ACKVOQ_19080 [Cyclobacteriaceae bacterium]
MNKIQTILSILSIFFLMTRFSCSKNTEQPAPFVAELNPQPPLTTSAIIKVDGVTYTNISVVNAISVVSGQVLITASTPPGQNPVVGLSISLEGVTATGIIDFSKIKQFQIIVGNITYNHTYTPKCQQKEIYTNGTLKIAALFNGFTNGSESIAGRIEGNFQGEMATIIEVPLYSCPGGGSSTIEPKLVSVSGTFGGVFANFNGNYLLLYTDVPLQNQDKTIKMGGELKGNGGLELVEKGVCYGLNENPEIDAGTSSRVVKMGDGSIGKFSKDVNASDFSGKTIHVRAYAVTLTGQAYYGQDNIIKLP